MSATRVGYGTIGPIPRDTLDEAKAYVGGLLARGAQVIRPPERTPSRQLGFGAAISDVAVSAADALRGGMATGWQNTADLLEESANGMNPVFRIGYGNRPMSFRVDPRLGDAVMTAGDVAGLGAVAKHTVKNTALGLMDAVKGGIDDAASGGMSRMFPGPKSKTWDAQRAERFEVGEKAGIDREKLWPVTGTTRLKDGSLAQEFSDDHLRIKQRTLGRVMDMRDVVSHPLLEQAYPDLWGKLRVRLDIDETMKGRGAGEYDSDKFTIKINAKNLDEARRILAHELQHSVSRYEGRATGGSPDMIGRIIDKHLDNADALNLDQKTREGLLGYKYRDFDAYQALQDETLARTTENGLLQSREFKRTNSPQQRMDVPESQQIVNKSTEPTVWMSSGDGASAPSSLLPRTKGAGEHTINIGMQVGDGTGENLGVTEVRRALKKLGVTIERDQIRGSNTEPTFVARLSRPLTDAEANQLSIDLRQEAIAQRSNGVGSMHGPQKAKWGEFNPKYFLDLQRRAKGQTVKDPLRLSNPAIYGNPREMAEEAASRVAPEDPLLRRLFGVGREDLFSLAQSRRSRIEMTDLYGGLGANPKGASHASQVTVPENARRIGDLLSEGMKQRGLKEGMVGWYPMDPLMEKYVAEFGQQEGMKRFEQALAAMSTHSFMSPVEVEMQRGLAANMMAGLGRYTDYMQYGGMKQAQKASLMPILSDVQGHVAHQGQSRAFLNYLMSRELPDSAKAPSYMLASGNPKIGFQTNLPVGDTHFAEAVGLNDVRPVTSGNADSREMLKIAPWFERIAEDQGTHAVGGQGLLWGVASKATGVDTAIGAPRLELYAKSVGKLAQKLGITPEEALQLIIKQRKHGL